MPRLSFPASFCIVFFSYVLQLTLERYAGVAGEFLFAALIILAFMISLPELLFFIAGSAWALNWQWDAGPDLAVFGAVPLVVFALRHMLPWRPSVQAALAILIGVAALYFATNHAIVLRMPKLFAESVVFSIVFGVLTLEIIQRLYPKGHDRVL